MSVGFGGPWAGRAGDRAGHACYSSWTHSHQVSVRRIAPEASGVEWLLFHPQLGLLSTGELLRGTLCLAEWQMKRPAKRAHGRVSPEYPKTRGRPLRADNGTIIGSTTGRMNLRN
jgi:hypothetical protein